MKVLMEIIQSLGQKNYVLNMGQMITHTSSVDHRERNERKKKQAHHVDVDHKEKVPKHP